jgi:hypothetical protein
MVMMVSPFATRLVSADGKEIDDFRWRYYPGKEQLFISIME